MINTCFSCSLIRKVLFKILVSFIPVTMILLLCFFVTSAEADPFPTEQKIVLEDKGKILIVHGSDCGTSEKLAKLDSVNLSGVLILPQYATDATVFLNGWYAGYTKDDEEIAQIHSEISSIKLSAGKLQWKAVGELADEESDEPYQWCYTYTAIAWNGNEIDAVPDHSDGSINRKSGKCSGNLNFIETNERYSLGVLASYMNNPLFASKKGVAILPRGYSFAWLPYFQTDTELHQIAYNMGHHERFIDPTRNYGCLPSVALKASRVGDGYVSWETHAVMRAEDDDNKSHRFWEFVSSLAGDDVGVVKPPFTVRASEWPGGGCIGSGNSNVVTEEHVIENIPFEYAVPMLTGWDLEYDCWYSDDVKYIGTWLHDLTYEKALNALGGRLRYKVSSILTDDDRTYSHRRHNITILGLVGISDLPDLLATSLPHTKAFCERVDKYTLIVRVKNGGVVTASASLTEVRFQGNNTFPGKLVTLKTPPIPANSSVDMKVNIPLGCYAPNCNFDIIVDVDNTVKESNEGNNRSVGQCKG